MDLNLKGKNALVCGSSKGIGKASALELALLGANITLVSRSAEVMENMLPELDQSMGQKHDYLVADFSDSKDLKNRVQKLLATKTIHILVNNTGGPPGGPILEAQPEAFLQALHNHLICNHVLTTLVVPGMRQDGYGRIINVISTSVREPISNLGVSNTTRGAVGNWAKTMANELGPDSITVNNVLPGYTFTERLQDIIKSWADKNGISEEEMAQKMKGNVPLRRFADPSEVASAVAFLASPAAAYISGTNVTVDGGRTKSH